jgi:wobble nucleotide-excising tRNase
MAAYAARSSVTNSTFREASASMQLTVRQRGRAPGGKRVLNKVVAINNVGRFRSYGASGDVFLRRYSLIFAENGRGKTTFCSILRSLIENNPDLLVGRQTLGSNAAQSVQLLTSGGLVTFRDGLWNGTTPDISVFDSTYVSDNVYAGDAVETTHRRSLYRVIIGAPGITLANQIAELDAKVRTQNGAIQENRARLQQYLPAGMTIDQFISLPADPSVDEKINAKEQDLQAVRRSEDLALRPGGTAVAIPVFPPAISEVLAKTLTNVAGGAMQRVRDHVAKHRMGERGEAWLNAGTSFVTDDSCPFCAQPVVGNDLIAAYQSFFSAEYRELRQRVDTLKAQVNTALGERAAGVISETIVQNVSTIEFWSTYSELKRPPRIPPDDVRAGLEGLRNAAVALLDAKAGMPLDAVAPTETFTIALQQFEDLRTRLSGHNAAIAAANVVIDETRRQSQTARATDVQNELARLKAKKARYTADVSLLCEKEGRLQSEKAVLEQQKDSVRTALDTYTIRVIDEYGQNINKYLTRFNAAFRITAPSHNYRGGTPSTSYQILINSRPVDLGDELTPMNRPSFRNTLSSGDRSTLALAFFLAQLDQDPARAQKVVVFDDPFTSMDAFRRTSTVYEIIKCGRECAQIILLSHEPLFLDAVWKELPAGDCKTLQFSRVGEENTRISEWNIEKALQSQQKADIEAIRRFHIESHGDPRSIASKIRVVIEGYARSVCPTQFENCATMGEIVSEIRAIGDTHLLFDVVDDLDQINIYSRKYHHPENPLAATEPIVDGEVAGVARRTLQLVGCVL